MTAATPSARAADVRWVAAEWARAGFTHAHVQPLFAPPGGAPLATTDALSLTLWRTLVPTPLHAMVRLWVLGHPVPASWCQQALPAWRDWAARGWVEARDRAIAPCASVSFHDGTPLVADPPHAKPEADHVMGATTATLLLERCLLPGPHLATLDLGTGSGLLALRLAASSQHVTATDVNPRALAYARLNTRLAKASHVRIVHGNGFSGLRPSGFDLVVGNLPFVLSPERRFVYRDGTPLEGVRDSGPDTLTAALVQQVGKHLCAGGFAQFLVQWPHPADLVDAGNPAAIGRAEENHLAGWLSGNGCHALFWRFGSQTLEAHALTWSAGAARDTASARVRRIGRWITGLRAAGVGAVSTGLVTLKRSDEGDRPFMRLEDVDPPQAPCGAALKDRFERWVRASRRGPRRKKNAFP